MVGGQRSLLVDHAKKLGHRVGDLRGFSKNWEEKVTITEAKRVSSLMIALEANRRLKEYILGKKDNQPELVLHLTVNNASVNEFNSGGWQMLMAHDDLIFALDALTDQYHQQLHTLGVEVP